MDITVIKPTNINTNNATNTSEGLYVTILAGLSKLEQTASITLATNITNLSMDLADSQFSDNNRDALRVALTAIITSSSITARLDSTVIYSTRKYFSQ